MKTGTRYTDRRPAGEIAFTERDAIVSARLIAFTLGATAAFTTAIATSGDAATILLVIFAVAGAISFMWWAGVAEADARVKATRDVIREARR